MPSLMESIDLIKYRSLIGIAPDVTTMSDDELLEEIVKWPSILLSGEFDGTQEDAELIIGRQDAVVAEYLTRNEQSDGGYVIMPLVVPQSAVLGG